MSAHAHRTSTRQAVHHAADADISAQVRALVARRPAPTCCVDVHGAPASWWGGGVPAQSARTRCSSELSRHRQRSKRRGEHENINILVLFSCVVRQLLPLSFAPSEAAPAAPRRAAAPAWRPPARALLPRQWLLRKRLWSASCVLCTTQWTAGTTSWRSSPSTPSSRCGARTRSAAQKRRMSLHAALRQHGPQLTLPLPRADGRAEAPRCAHRACAACRGAGAFRQAGGGSGGGQRSGCANADGRARAAHAHAGLESRRPAGGASRACAAPPRAGRLGSFRLALPSTAPRRNRATQPQHLHVARSFAALHLLTLARLTPRAAGHHSVRGCRCRAAWRPHAPGRALRRLRARSALGQAAAGARSASFGPTPVACR